MKRRWYCTVCRTFETEHPDIEDFFPAQLATGLAVFDHRSGAMLLSDHALDA